MPATDETKATLDTVQASLERNMTLIRGSQDERAAYHGDLVQKIAALKTTVDEVHFITNKPEDPKHATYAKAAADAFAEMGGAATEIANTIRLAQANRPQEAAAAGLRATSSILKTVSPLIKVVPPPAGPVISAVLDALSGLTDFVATILGLTKPEGPPEPSLADVLWSQLEKAFAEQQINEIFGASFNLNGMGVTLREAVKQGIKVERWPDALSYADIVGGGGEALSLNTCKAWLKRRENWATLDPEKWALVFALYVQASRQYLDLYVLLLQLFEPQRLVRAGGPKVDNPDVKVAYAAIGHFVREEERFINEITPIAVSQAMVFHGHNVDSWVARKGLSNEVNWFRAGGSGWIKLLAGPHERLWGLTHDGKVYGTDITSSGDHVNFGQWSALFELEGAYKGCIDISVVALDDNVTEIHGLSASPDDGAGIASFFAWDRTADPANRSGKRCSREERYGTGAPPPKQVKFHSIAASPDGFLYLAGDDGHLWFWTDKGSSQIRLVPAPSTFDQEFNVGGVNRLESGYRLVSSSTTLYLLGSRKIAFKRHEDISRENLPWQLVPVPNAKELKLPDQWAFQSVCEGEGLSLLAAIGPVGSREMAEFYTFINGVWSKQTKPGEHGNILGTFPLACRDEFSALKDSILSLRQSLSR